MVKTERSTKWEKRDFWFELTGVSKKRGFENSGLRLTWYQYTGFSVFSRRFSRLLRSSSFWKKCSLSKTVTGVADGIFCSKLCRTSPNFITNSPHVLPHVRVSSTTCINSKRTTQHLTYEGTNKITMSIWRAGNVFSDQVREQSAQVLLRILKSHVSLDTWLGCRQLIAAELRFWAFFACVGMIE